MCARRKQRKSSGGFWVTTAGGGVGTDSWKLGIASVQEIGER